MSLNELVIFLARISYKPNWRFECADKAPFYETGGGYMKAVWITIKHTSIDANDPEKMTEVVLTACVAKDQLVRMDEPQMMDWIKMHIRKAEDHETDEWLRLDGKWVKDPHPELRS